MDKKNFIRAYRAYINNVGLVRHGWLFKDGLLMTQQDFLLCKLLKIQ